MRIISGVKRGAKLMALPGDDTRPTTDRVKESLFNIIQWEIRGSRVLDLFAGSGALGLEALSRGADYVCFADNNPAAVKVLNANISKIDFVSKSKVVCGDFRDLIRGDNNKYDIIFLDPPYASDYIHQCLVEIQRKELLANGGIIVCETTKDKLFDTSGFKVRKEAVYGITKLVFLEVCNDE